MSNVLAIGAHPDDVEFGCAGTLARHVHEGDQVTILHMSASDAMNLDNEVVPAGEIRRKEAKEAARIIGADVVILDFLDQLVPFDRESIFAIERVINARKIDIIYSHWNGDSHQDHLNTLKSVFAAARHVDKILLFEQVPFPRVGKIFSEVNYFVDITDFYEIKELASLAHESQVVGRYQNKIMKGMRSLAEFRGSQSECKYAEAFESVRQIIR
ncbi:MAG: PIG-L family deacetylase [Bacteroidia bacterium]|nr:PIG-L family deacetylase [Bacteroidia bacterium]